eukprot:CAMPEP_0201559606 /NCGR_PEP_ID=MMETSP0173_2-20130828/75138_1 /ASSEMBLY_ACC=CAM_ASM_000268 /TAXON_ID=218659 /ORGANISM="Vexillifera sp., Strain DIVA3 564/2" /LENGTH=41 /DNA_ID= /DNA_START= /DNA_END= /DNA_ORIENTATION=
MINGFANICSEHAMEKALEIYQSLKRPDDITHSTIIKGLVN